MSQNPSIEVLPVTAIVPDPRNARTHSKAQLRQIADSILEFGFTNPVLIDRTNQLIAGHGRLAAAKLLELETVPAIRLSHLNPDQKRALAIADNKIAMSAGWDIELLAEELAYLIETPIDFDVAVTGFSTPEIDLVIGDAEDQVDDEPPVPDLPSDREVVSRLGDLWLLGRHRLLCGDATNDADVARLMGNAKAQIVFVDVPYNVDIAGNVSGLGKAQHGEFVMASGEMTPDEYTDFLGKALKLLAAHSQDGSLHYICMDWRHMGELQAAANGVYAELVNLCVWNKTNGGMGSFYRSKHELVFVYRNGKKRHINNVELGRHGRNRTNVWDYAGTNTFREGRLDDLAAHPTVKPIALVADVLLDATHRLGIVLDTFAGSGTTILAAERVGRGACAMELDPRYVDVALQRWMEATGEMPVLESSRETFAGVRERRRAETEMETSDA